jgi:hypothetical protein
MTLFNLQFSDILNGAHVIQITRDSEYYNTHIDDYIDTSKEFAFVIVERQECSTWHTALMSNYVISANNCEECAVKYNKILESLTYSVN